MRSLVNLRRKYQSIADAHNALKDLIDPQFSDGPPVILKSDPTYKAIVDTMRRLHDQAELMEWVLQLNVERQFGDKIKTIELK